MLLIALFVIWLVLMLVWLLGLLGAVGVPVSASNAWLPFLVSLVLGVVLFLVGGGYVAFR
jgi:hypothetical protein